MPLKPEVDQAHARLFSCVRATACADMATRAWGAAALLAVLVVFNALLCASAYPDMWADGECGAGVPTGADAFDFEGHHEAVQPDALGTALSAKIGDEFVMDRKLCPGATHNIEVRQADGGLEGCLWARGSVLLQASNPRACAGRTARCPASPTCTRAKTITASCASAVYLSNIQI